MRRLICGMAIVASCVSATAAPGDRETKVRGDRRRVEETAYWIYNDLPRGIATAKESGKPLLVVFRCIPCEACAQLDEEVVERDKRVRDLLDKFVCVRIVHANGLDLSLFQYDYDQSWAAFLMNADLTIYGRYGTRSHETESKDDISLEGFSKALTTALAWHQDFPKHREALQAKRGADSAIKVPEEFPSLKGKYGSKLDYEGKVVQSCIHCHQVGEALRKVARSAGQPVSDKVLYPYPNPKILGLILDPQEKAKVKQVVAGSVAEQTGIQVGDEISSLNGQPILSIADVQWVLHHAGETDTIAANIQRNGKPHAVKLTLAKGWRQKSDISWRATSWDLRRIALGGLRLETASDDLLQELKLPAGKLALRAKHVGQYNDHAVAKNAGFIKDDVIIAIDGDSTPITESGLMAKLLNSKRPGDMTTFLVRRGNRELEMKFGQQ